MENKIFVILFAIATTSVTAVYFECEYDYFRMGNHLGTRYSCHGIPSGDLNDPQVRGISGNHMAGRDNTDVVGFYIYHDKSMNFIPRGLTQFFPNMLGLALLNCSLVTLGSNDLLGYGVLQALSLRENYIERIPVGFYEHVPNLWETNMFHNRLTHVAPNALAPLVRLLNASFLENICVNMAADTSMLPTLQNVLNTNCTYT